MRVEAEKGLLDPAVRQENLGYADQADPILAQRGVYFCHYGAEGQLNAVTLFLQPSSMFHPR
jgi:hypothetical protein